jgi:hypothetical protein
MVRKYLGYERMEYREIVPLLNYYYAEIVCPLVNHFMPSFKLADKVTVKSRTRRVYKAPMTPYQRLMNSDFLTENQKLRLELTHKALNPVALSKEEFRVRKLIDSCLKSMRVGTGMLPRTPAYELWNAIIPQVTNTGRENRIY